MKKTKKQSSLRRFLTNIYGFSFFNSFLLLAPVYTVFMQDNGMSDMQVSVLLMMWSVGVFFAQIPAAWATNKLGAKNIINIGQILKAASFILWLAFPTFIGFTIGSLLWGVQGAIYNVAFEGMLYDELKARQHHDVYAKVLGRRRIVSALGSALSAAGSLLLFFGYDWITWASVLSVGLSILFIFRIKPQHKPKKKVRKNTKQPSFIKVFVAGAKIVRKTPCILYMMLLSILVANFSYLTDYLSLIGVEVGLRKEFIGIVPFFIQGCQMIGQNFAHRFTRIKDWQLYASVSVAGAVYVLFAIFYSVSGLLLLGLGYVMFAAIKILMYSRFQDFVPSTYRSVVLSLYSILDQIAYMAVLLIIGFGGDMGGWRYGALFLGMGCIAIGLWAILFVKDRCAIDQNPNIKVLKTAESTSSTSPSQF